MAAVFDPSTAPDLAAPTPAVEPVTKAPSREEALAMVAEASRRATKALGEPVAGAGAAPAAPSMPLASPITLGEASSGRPFTPGFAAAPPPVPPPMPSNGGNGAAHDEAILVGGRHFTRPKGWLAEQDKLVDAQIARHEEGAARALEKAGGRIRASGWDVAAPTWEKLAQRLDLASDKPNLCATCKHAVQMVVPFVEGGGMRDYHATHTYCEVVLVEGGKNLDLTDEPVHYCSHRQFSAKAWIERKVIGLKARAEKSGATGRVKRALRVLGGTDNG